MTSCGDDESLSESIVGTWQLETIAINSCPDSANNLAAVSADSDGCAILNGTMVCQTVTFSADGSLGNRSVTDGVVQLQSRTYTVDEGSMQVTSCDNNNNCSTISVLDGRISLSSQFGDCIIISTYVK